MAADKEWRTGTHWESRTEWLAKGVEMTCYRRPTPYHGNGPDRAWMYVNKCDHSRTMIEKYLIEPSDPLLIECMAHEMRAKYGAKQDG